MYTTRPFRYNEYNYKFINKLYELRGPRWREDVVTGRAIKPGYLRDGFEWLPDFAHSIVNLMTDQQFPFLERALDRAAHKLDRAFLICALIDGELLHRSGRVQDDHLQELTTYLLQRKELDKAYPLYGHGVRVLLSRGNYPHAELVISRLAELISATPGVSSEELYSFVALFQEAWHHKGEGNLWSKVDGCAVDYLLYTIELCQPGKAPENDRLLDISPDNAALHIKQFSHELGPLFVYLLIQAVLSGSVITERDLVRIALDGTTLNGIPYGLFRQFNVDPDEALARVENEGLPCRPLHEFLQDYFQDLSEDKDKLVPTMSIISSLLRHNPALFEL